MLVSVSWFIFSPFISRFCFFLVFISVFYVSNLFDAIRFSSISLSYLLLPRFSLLLIPRFFQFPFIYLPILNSFILTCLLPIASLFMSSSFLRFYSVSFSLIFRFSYYYYSPFLPIFVIIIFFILAFIYIFKIPLLNFFHWFYSPSRSYLIPHLHFPLNFPFPFISLRSSGCYFPSFYP